MKCTANQCNEHNVEKYQWITMCHGQYGSIFICLAVIGSQICEISGNSLQIRIYSTSRSSKVNDLGANRKRIQTSC